MEFKPHKKRQSAVIVECDWCGADIKRWPSKIKERNYCSRACLAKNHSKVHNPDGYKKLKDYSAQSKNMARINRELNPNRMTPEVRAKLRQSHLKKGKGISYEKTHGRHTHRIVMEEKLGRPLREEEIVHHIDGDHRNNDPDNLMVLTRSEHINLHRAQGDLRRKSG